MSDRGRRTGVRAAALLLTAIALGACGDDPDDGAARLEEVGTDVDRAGTALGDALTDTFGGSTETGPTDYSLCSSAPVEGLSYLAQWRIRDADRVPDLDLATEVVTESGWETEDVSPAQGQLPATTFLSRDDVRARLSVDDGTIGWEVESSCIRVTSEEVQRRAAPPFRTELTDPGGRTS